jgi:hypothetical protein
MLLLVKNPDETLGPADDDDDSYPDPSPSRL